MTATTTITAPRSIPLDEYTPIIGQPEVDELRALAGSLRGHLVQMATLRQLGGGVAEILTRFRGEPCPADWAGSFPLKDAA